MENTIYLWGDSIGKGVVYDAERKRYRLGRPRCEKLLLERGLSDLQENIMKVMLAFPDDRPMPKGLDVLHDAATGRMHTLILRGDAETIRAQLTAERPQFMDVVPLSLEEIFIYELGGADYAVKDILL